MRMKGLQEFKKGGESDTWAEPGWLTTPNSACFFSVDMASGLVALQAAVDLMTSNKYHEAVRLLKPKSVIALSPP